MYKYFLKEPDSQTHTWKKEKVEANYTPVFAKCGEP
jgi:hypothetical protein